MQKIIGQWLYSLKHYLYMCVFLSSPDRLPHSPYPIALTGLVYFLLGLLLVDAERSYLLICAQILLELGMLGLIAYFGLLLKQSLERFLQTFAALLGINVVFTALSIPAYRFIVAGGGDGNLLLITVVLLVWNLAVLSLIFKRAFDVSTHVSAMISFFYFVLYQTIVYWLSP